MTLTGPYGREGGVGGSKAKGGRFDSGVVWCGGSGIVVWQLQWVGNQESSFVLSNEFCSAL